MRVRRDALRKFDRRVAPAPAPIEPRLSAFDEARRIVKGDPSDPDVWARRTRALALLRRPATPEGADAELLALLAAAGALPVERRDDRLSARLRLVAIANVKDPLPEVAKLFAKLRASPGDGEAFAEALLPASQDSGGNFFIDWGMNASGGV